MPFAVDHKMKNSFYSVSQNLTLRSVESSVIEFSEQGGGRVILRERGIELPSPLSERSSWENS
ncbi:hypothetical protein QMM11_17475, partial [Leptospira santarosai]|nr:hypothetical protein [Leptospira santarosai]